MKAANWTGISQQAEGAIDAQQALQAVRGGIAPIGLIWLRFVELGARYGDYAAPACAAYLNEVAKAACR